jgi:hypothetical protein
MIRALISRSAAVATAGYVALAQPFAPSSNFAFILLLALIVCADLLDLVPARAGH